MTGAITPEETTILAECAHRDPTPDEILAVLGTADIGWRGSDWDYTGGGLYHLVIDVMWGTDEFHGGDFFDVRVGPFDADGEFVDEGVSVWDATTDENGDEVGDHFGAETLAEILDLILYIRASRILVELNRQVSAPTAFDVSGVRFTPFTTT